MSEYTSSSMQPQGSNEKNSQSVNARAALRYAEMGMYVFPCHRAATAGLCSCGKPECDSPGKHPRTEHGYKNATRDRAQIEGWWLRWPDANVGVATGASDLVVIDIDPRHGGDETWAALIGELGAGIEQTARVLTPQGGKHLYFRAPTGAAIKSDPDGFGAGVEIKAEGAYVIIWGRTLHGVYSHDPASPRKIAPLPERLRQRLVTPQKKTPPPAPAGRIPEGQRNTVLTSMAGKLRRAGFTPEAIKAALLVENATRCDPPLAEAEVQKIAASIGKYPPGVIALWPVLPPEALRGLAGEVVRTIAPHTEADQVALLLQFLLAFGNAVGRGPYFQVESTQHHLNEFTIIVGNTSRARKGTSWDHVKRLFEFAAADWTKYRIQSGLSTGEGLVHAVRDERWERGKLVDGGVQDKRLLAQESEFSRPLRVMGREGNILSELIRLAWDTGNLQIITKTTPAKATGAHISIVSHITQAELHRRLSDTDTLSGFANRFLFALAQRSKILPDGGSLSPEVLAPLKAHLAEVVAFASTVGELKRDAKAHDLWREVYHPLTTDAPGLFGTTISRAEAHVVRLSALYAVLDKSKEIRLSHLLGALAVWQYCEASCAAIFGRALGDKTADRILAALQERRDDGMTRTEIRDMFGRNKSEEEIARALNLLEENGLAEAQQEQTERRPAERWKAKGNNVVNVVRSYTEIAKKFIWERGWEGDLVPPSTPPDPPPPGCNGDSTTERHNDNNDINDKNPEPSGGQVAERGRAEAPPAAPAGVRGDRTEGTEAPIATDRDIGTEGTKASPPGATSELVTKADDRQQWGVFFEAWFQMFGEVPRAAEEIAAALLDKSSILRACLPSEWNEMIKTDPAMLIKPITVIESGKNNGWQLADVITNVLMRLGCGWFGEKKEELLWFHQVEEHSAPKKSRKKEPQPQPLIRWAVKDLMRQAKAAIRRSVSTT